MLKILYFLLFNICTFSCLCGQDLHQIKAFSDELYRNGNHQQALKEYQRVMFFDTHHEFQGLYGVIASMYYQRSDYKSALKYYDYGMRIENNDSIKIELAFKKALCNFKQNNYLEALSELFDLPVMSDDYLESKKSLYLGISYFGLENYDDSQKYFSSILDSSGIIQLNEIYTGFNSFSTKFNPEKVEWMSKIIPGLGQIYTGHISSGLNSFFLLSGIMGYAVITALNYGTIDGLLILSSWFNRYYSGGYTNAGEFAGRKISDKKAEAYGEIFKLIEKHPKPEIDQGILQ